MSDATGTPATPVAVRPPRTGARAHSAGLAIACALNVTCGAPDRDVASDVASAGEPAVRLSATDGFSGPEAVRYDADQDVYFVSNFNGSGSDRDDNGFISRMRPDGTIDSLRFIAGGANGVTLHAPRGMTIVGDTLWACDVDAVRGFHRLTGSPVAVIDFSGHDVGFLNDIAADADGTLYVTDTGRNRIYRITGGSVSVALEDDSLGSPNGITYDAANGRFIIVPYGGSNDIFAWQTGTSQLEVIGSGDGGRYDGVELLDGRIIVASQADTALHVFENGAGQAVARTAGRPADIALDTRRRRIAVPFIALNQVEIWQLPEQ